MGVDGISFEPDGTKVEVVLGEAGCFPGRDSWAFITFPFLEGGVQCLP